MSKRLRIAMLTHSTNPRGGVVHAMQLSEALSALGHDVTLLAPDARGDGFFRSPLCPTVTFRVAPAHRDMTAMVEQRIEDYVRHFEAQQSEPFDLYHAHDGISANALATLKSRGLISGFVRTVHHMDDFEDPRLRDLQDRAIVAADACLTVSRTWRDHLRHRFGITATLGGNGVDTSRFLPARQSGDEGLRSRLGVQHGPVFLCVGGIEERKNTIRILQAFIDVAAIRADVQLVIAGGASLLDHGTYKGAFRHAMAVAGPAAHRVSITGPVLDEDMPALYRMASALVFASIREGFGLCVLEALACGTPVIASHIEPFTEYLAAGDVLWCDPSRTASISDSMAMVLHSEQNRAFARRGPEVASRFDWAHVAEAHVPLYQSVRELTNA
jgi:glycosyltransferase-like protein